jgi:hypothetical protein
VTTATPVRWSRLASLMAGPLLFLFAVLTPL